MAALNGSTPGKLIVIQSLSAIIRSCYTRAHTDDNTIHLHILRRISNRNISTGVSMQVERPGDARQIQARRLVDSESRGHEAKFVVCCILNHLLDAASMARGAYSCSTKGKGEQIDRSGRSTGYYQQREQLVEIATIMTAVAAHIAFPFLYLNRNSIF